jgi:UDP-N-acetylglucosamine transferase subunit ALG13
LIFVSIGTSEPFDRLLTALGDVARREPVLVQRGRSSIELPGAEIVDFMSFDTFIDSVRRARVVVTHAGVGSVLAVVSTGKRPVVVPRMRAFGEAVDDHQLPFARRLHDKGLVVLVEDLSQLKDAIDAIPTGGEPATLVPRQSSGALVEDLRKFLDEEIGRPTAAPLAGAL